jgi:hypothetical protein
MTVELTVLVTERLFHFAPFAVVVSAAGSIVISTTTFSTSSAATPTDSFRVGDVLTVYDPVNNVEVGSGVTVTTIPSTISMNVSDLGGSLPLSPGWVLLFRSAPSPTLASTDTFTPADYTYGDGGDVPSRWR